MLFLYQLMLFIGLISSIAFIPFGFFLKKSWLRKPIRNKEINIVIFKLYFIINGILFTFGFLFLVIINNAIPLILSCILWFISTILLKLNKEKR